MPHKTQVAIYARKHPHGGIFTPTNPSKTPQIGTKWAVQNPYIWKPLIISSNYSMFEESFQRLLRDLKAEDNEKASNGSE